MFFNRIKFPPDHAIFSPDSDTYVFRMQKNPIFDEKRQDIWFKIFLKGIGHRRSLLRDKNIR
jgi:hypothetical protein